MRIFCSTGTQTGPAELKAVSLQLEQHNSHSSQVNSNSRGCRATRARCSTHSSAHTAALSASDRAAFSASENVDSHVTRKSSRTQRRTGPGLRAAGSPRIERLCGSASARSSSRPSRSYCDGSLTSSTERKQMGQLKFTSSSDSMTPRERSASTDLGHREHSRQLLQEGPLVSVQEVEQDAPLIVGMSLSTTSTELQLWLLAYLARTLRMRWDTRVGAVESRCCSRSRRSRRDPAIRSDVWAATAASMKGLKRCRELAWLRELLL
uniref:Uncharacterized protein n=1 Tax=Macrostomum lignano TaxID=282301 RepID=A0A1I8FK02_9PLAT